MKTSIAHLSWALLFCAATVLADAPASKSASALAPKAKKIISIEGVTEYRLANGLKVLLYPDQSSSTVTVNITYMVGSRHESYGETGMAHLLEHLNFKGTPKHPNIPAELSKRGADTNATTSYDRTNYFETLPATDDNLKWALELEADRMLNSFIAKKDLDSEMTVVRNEFERGENEPGQVLYQRVLATSYLWHNYGHPTIGSRADIEGVPIERLQKFYHTYYQPDNATLIVAGKFEEPKTLALVERIYGPLPKPTRALPAVYTAEPTQDGEREVVLRRAGNQKILIHAYHITADAHPDSVALGVLVAMLNQRPAGLLYKRLVESKLAVSASASLAPMYDPGYLTISVATTKEGDLDAVRRELDGILKTVSTTPFAKAELERIRNEQFNGYEKMMTSSQQVADLLSENVAIGDWRLLFWDRDQLNHVTVEDAQRVAAKYLVASNRTVGTFVPEDQPLRAAIPQTPDINKMLEGYKGQAAVAAGENFDTAPLAIEARVKRGTVGNIKTAYLEKKTRGDRVSGVLVLHFGEEQSLQNKAEAAGFAAALLMRGTQKHGRQELQDELTKLKATMSVSGGPTGVRVGFETVRENLPATMALAAEVLKQPAFPANELEEMKRSSLANIDNARSDPNSIARLAAQRYMSPYAPGHFRYVGTFDERAAAVSKVTLADVQDFYKQFYGANAVEAAFVGNFDSAEVSRLLAQHFGSWKSAMPYQRVKSIFKPLEGKTQTFETPDKANAVFSSVGTLSLRDDNPDYPALIVGNEILGGGFLNSRLATRIRQKDGLSYTVGSGLDADSLDPVGSFSFYAICAPENIGKVEKGAQEEIARVLSEGYTDKEIAEAKSGVLQSWKLSRSSDGQLAGTLASHLFLDRDFKWEAEFEKRLEAVTPAAIKDAMNRYIDLKTMYTVKAGDFAKKGT